MVIRILTEWSMDHDYKITPDEALALARGAARDRGLPWIEPTVLTDTWRAWVVVTNGDSRGDNVTVKLSKSDGHIISVKRR